MDTHERIGRIETWISDYQKQNSIESFVVGISGGIDSAVVSTLCARTGVPTYAVSMPIKQKIEQHSLSVTHGEWLSEKYPHVKYIIKDLTNIFLEFEDKFSDMEFLHGLANSRARLRMMSLYQIAAFYKGIVVGTGNKVEDFGVGFYTKYGDGGVDISPIADCMKTEVWDMGRVLGIDQKIIDAAPTDGLWDDGRNDEGQLGMSYPELELAMIGEGPQENIDKFLGIQKQNLHKMNPIPVCKVS